jgi:hypothetical protein
MARNGRRDLASMVFRPKHDYLPGTDILRQVDVDGLAGKLDLEARGKKDGEAERPGEAERSRTAAEADIQGALQEKWDEALKGAKRAHEGLRGRFASLTAETELDTLMAEPAAVALTLHEAAREERDRLLFQFRAVSEARDELDRFKAREEITRPPREGQHAIVKLAFLAFAALLELIVNASIFAGGDEYGLVGAITKVVVIPIANIGGCFLWTHWLARQILARAPERKAVGVFGWLLTAAWLLGLNLAVAHWRDASGALMTPDSAQAALNATFSEPLHLRSFQSWGLFLVGCFAGAVAIWEGWNWADPHPGYSRRVRQSQGAIDAFRNLRDFAMERLRGEADAGANRLIDAQRTAEMSISQRPALAATAASLAEDIKLFADHLRRVGDELATRYREANRRARKTPPPARFEEPPALDLVLPDLATLKAGVATRPLAGRLAEAVDRITAAHGEACAILPSLSELEEPPAPDDKNVPA